MLNHHTAVYLRVLQCAPEQAKVSPSRNRNNQCRCIIVHDVSYWGSSDIPHMYKRKVLSCFWVFIGPFRTCTGSDKPIKCDLRYIITLFVHISLSCKNYVQSLSFLIVKHMLIFYLNHCMSPFSFLLMFSFSFRGVVSSEIIKHIFLT